MGLQLEMKRIQCQIVNDPKISASCAKWKKAVFKRMVNLYLMQNSGQKVTKVNDIPGEVMAKARLHSSTFCDI